MRDIDVRRALRAQTLAKHYADPRSRVIEELGLCQGEARVDLAVVNGSLHGYEIKSERDTLNRLGQQAEAYGLVFDEMTLVLSEKHLASALEQIPPWWGVVVASPNRAGIGLRHHRKGKRNKTLSAFHLAQLLWRNETLRVLEGIGQSRGFASKPRTVLWQALADAVPLSTLRRVVRETLKVRAAWR